MNTPQNPVEQAFGCRLSRRRFLQALMAAGVLSALPGGLLTTGRGGRVFGEEIDLSAQIRGGYAGDVYDVFRNACPRNCYDTCGIKSYVRMAYSSLSRAPKNRPLRMAVCASRAMPTRAPSTIPTASNIP